MTARNILRNGVYLAGAASMGLGTFTYLRTRKEQRQWQMGNVASCSAGDEFDLIGKAFATEFQPYTERQQAEIKPKDRVKYDFKLKSRKENLEELKNTEYDLLIIGGGANGAGVALDAAARGLKCAVVDSYDFAAGTSSKSTKMAHGGIRYFQQMCFLQGDPIESY